MKRCRTLMVLVAGLVGLSSVLLFTKAVAFSADPLAISVPGKAGRAGWSIPNWLQPLYQPALISETISTSASPQANKDQFGYVMVTNILEEAAFNAEWEELKGSSAYSMTIPSDNGLEIDIGFSFPFYEGDYSKVYVNDNGLLTFGEKTQRPSSSKIPLDTAPNNYIAAFWDNLDVGKENVGKVYYARRGSAPNRYLLVEWADVTRAGDTFTLTFQIKLTEAGNIFFYYKEMNNNGAYASAGIEDPDGVDGIQVAYHQEGFLTNRRKVVFSRPADAPRVKVLPPYRGQFVVGGSAIFPILIRNTSDALSNDYTLSNSPVPGWSVAYLNPQTLQPMPLPISLAAGASKSLYVLVRPQTVMNPGSYTAFTVTVQSRINPAVKAYARLQAAVPAAFALAYYQSPDYKVLQDGRSFIELIWNKSQYSQSMQDPFSGRNLAFTRTPNKTYVYAWDHPQSPSEVVSYREVSFLILNQFGGILRGVTDIVDHTSSQASIADTEPAVAVAPSGRIAFAWKRAHVGAGGGSYIENVYFVVRNSDGSVLQTTPVQVTDSVVGKRVDNITVAATTDNQFILVWVRQLGVVDPNKELWYAVFNHHGVRITPNQKIAGEAGYHYSYPGLVDLRNGKVLLSFTREDTATGLQQVIKYRVCSTDCHTATEHTLNNAHGRNSRAVLFSNGQLLLVWTNSWTERISYVVILNYNSPDPNLVPSDDLSAPVNRSQDYPSLLLTPQNQAVLVWMDAVNSNYFFYALLGENGEIITPPMSFMGETGGLGINASDMGQALALYDGSYRVYAPQIRK